MTVKYMNSSLIALITFPLQPMLAVTTFACMEVSHHLWISQQLMFSKWNAFRSHLILDYSVTCYGQILWKIERLEEWDIFQMNLGSALWGLVSTQWRNFSRTITTLASYEHTKCKLKATKCISGRARRNSHQWSLCSALQITVANTIIKVPLYLSKMKKWVSNNT